MRDPLRHRVARAQRGLSLIEVAIATAVGATLLVSLGESMRMATRAQVANTSLNDLTQQGRFALQRIEAAIRATPSSATLAAKGSDDSSGNWLASSTYRTGGVTFCLRGTQLIEKSPATTTCTTDNTDRVLAESVSAFSVLTWSPGTALQRNVLDVSLTLASGERSITLASRVRLGGGTS